MEEEVEAKALLMTFLFSWLSSILLTCASFVLSLSVFALIQQRPLRVMETLGSGVIIVVVR